MHTHVHTYSVIHTHIHSLVHICTHCTHTTHWSTPLYVCLYVRARQGKARQGDALTSPSVSYLPDITATSAHPPALSKKTTEMYVCRQDRDHTSMNTRQGKRGGSGKEGGGAAAHTYIHTYIHTCTIAIGSPAKRRSNAGLPGVYGIGLCSNRQVVLQVLMRRAVALAKGTVVCVCFSQKRATVSSTERGPRSVADRAMARRKHRAGPP